MPKNSSRNFGNVTCRVQDANNMYVFKWNETNGQLHKRVSGTWSAIGSATAGVADDSVVALRCEGDTITALDDGNTLRTVTDTSISAAGYAGVGMGAVVTASDDVSSQDLDDYEVQELSSSSGVTTRYLHTDHLGGMNVTSDETGLADEVVDYHPYGTERIRLGDTQDQRQYAGTERDTESDLDYMINRGNWGLARQKHKERGNWGLARQKHKERVIIYSWRGSLA